MKPKTQTHLALPDNVRCMAGMAAARDGLTLSDYIANLVVEHCRRIGVADLVEVAREKPADAAL